MTFNGGTFQIRNKDLEWEERVGLVSKYFGIHKYVFTNDEDQMDHIFTITHLVSGWRVIDTDTIGNAKEAVKLLEQNPDWQMIRTDGSRCLYIPDSCRAQIKEMR